MVCLEKHSSMDKVWGKICTKSLSVRGCASPCLCPPPPFLSCSLRWGSYQSTSETALFNWWLRFVNSSDLMCVKPMTSRKQVPDPTHTVLPYVADRSAAISCWSLKSNELCKWMWIADCLEFSLQFLSIL